MILLLTFAFLAGIVTVLSPCILPILPIILSSSIGGAETSRSRPIGVAIGFILSFTIFTLTLSTIVQWLNIPADTLRLLSVLIIAGFGVSMLIPQFQLFIEKMFSKFAGYLPNTQNKTGLGGGLLIGFSVGLLWTPCVGPILASVISLAITGTVTFQAFLITFAYSIGTAIPMFLIMLGGQTALKRVPWLTKNLEAIQKVFGVLMILTAMAIFFNFDRKFQTAVLQAFPGYGTGLTKLEDNDLVREQLDKKPKSDRVEPKGIKAPEIIAGGEWFNSEPLSLAELKGKVVLIDFWTYSCINCQRTFPYLREWHSKYKDKGLVIIGVHSPEFEFEKDENNVAQAISDFKIEYPVMQDNDFATWRAYNNRYWPAKYFIDKNGNIRSYHFGEGAYDESERLIQELLSEAGANAETIINNPTYQNYGRTPELYLGYGRIDHFESPEPIKPDSLSSYTAPANLGQNELAYQGNWFVNDESANPQAGSQLHLNFDAKEVFLVMRTKGESSKVKVFVDDKLQYFGEDNDNGTVTVTKDTLYKLINLPEPGKHNLRLDFEDNNIEVFAFTFG